MAKGLDPLMSIKIPDDFRCVPRILAYVLDEPLRERITEIAKSYFHLPEDPRRTKMQYLNYGMFAVEERLRIRLEPEFAVRELPARQEDEFLVLVVVFASKYRELDWRPTEWQMHELNKAFRREPEWLIHTLSY